MAPEQAVPRYGALSPAFGVMALIASIAVKEFELLRNPARGYILDWMDRLGLIRQPHPDQVPEWRADGVFELTDDRALKWLLVYSVCFALWAMLLALLGEHRREASRGTSLGFILGALALHIRGVNYSLSALLVGAIGLAVIRWRLRAEPSIAPSGQVLQSDVPRSSPHG